MDGESDVRQDLAGLLRDLGVETVEFSNSGRLVEHVDDQDPDIVFINLNAAAPYDCVRAILSLRECGYTGDVQIVGRGQTSFLESFHKIGVDSSLKMLPVLQKPIELSTIRRIVHAHGFSGTPVPPPELSLEEALANDWIKFWFQPKIEFKTDRIVGAEAVARIEHPQYGILSPGRFIGGAGNESLIEMTRRALLSAVKTSADLDRLGLRLKIAINISVEALVKLPIGELVLKSRPGHDEWAGLVFDVTEREVVNEIALVKSRFNQLKEYGVSLAIDDFGRGNSSLAIFKHLACEEIKIHSSFVNGCAGNKGNSNICKTMTQLAHNFGSTAVAIGIETDADAMEIMNLGCDIGQGFLFGKPVAEQEFIATIISGQRPAPQARNVHIAASGNVA